MRWERHIRIAMIRVVAPPGDDGPLRVAVEEADDDLLADARQELGTEVGPSPAFRHRHPAGATIGLERFGAAALVGACRHLALPGKPHSHAAKTIGVEIAIAARGDVLA